MSYYKPTVIAIVAAIAVITVYDVWALAGGYERTISSVLLQVARDWPVVPFLFGLLVGHLWFPNRATGTRE